MKSIRFLSIALAAALCITSFTGSAFAFSAPASEIDEGTAAASFSDDFDSYPPDWSKTGNSVELGGGWVSKPAENGDMGVGNAAVFGFSNSKLKVGTYTSTHDKFISDVMKNEVGILHSVPAGISKNQVINVCAEKSHSSDVWGVKFLNHNGGKSYYVFLVSGSYTRGDNSYYSNYGIYKFDNGTKSIVYEQARTNSNANEQGGYASSGGTTALEIAYYNGEISYNFVHTVNSEKRIVYSGCVTDVSPFELENDEDLSVELFAAGSTNASRAILFDDFSIKESIPYITTGEPTNVLYAEATQSAYTDDDGVVDMQEESRVRVVESEASAGQTFDLYLSNDKTEWDKISNCSFGENGKWINTKASGKYRYLALSFADVPTDLKVYTDADARETYTVVLGKDYILKAKFGDVTDNTFYEWTLSQDSATVENGVLHPVRRGELSISAIYQDTEISATVNIIGPLDMAVKNDTVAAYINENKGIVDEINSGIQSDDNAKIAAVLTNTGAYKIEDIIDIESKKITELDEQSLDKYINRIKTYGVLPFETAEDAYNLIDIFETEYYVGLVCGVSDYAVLGKTFETRNGFYKLDLENEYYKKHSETVLDSMLNTEYKNIQNLRDTFISAYVLTAFEKALSIEMVEDVVVGCGNEIAYDLQHFEKNKCDDMYSSLLETKSNIKTLANLKKFIDGYKKPATNSNSGNSSTGGSSGGGGGSSKTSSGGKGEFSIGTDLIESINKQTKPERIEIKPVEYGDLDNSHWAYDSISKLSNLKIVSGNPDGSFRPNDAVTRAEFLKILVTAFQDDISVDADKSFEDVAKDDWYYECVNKAYSAGIVTGDADGKIRPDDKMTREEMAALIFRTLKLTEKDTANIENVSINDMDEVSEWAKEAVTALYTKGILKGNELGNFAPKDNTTRAETCAVVERLLK